MIEIISAFPIWLPVKAKMTMVNGNQFSREGLFGSKTRNPLFVFKQIEKMIGSIEIFGSYL